jgi:hypothetical protein
MDAPTFASGHAFTTGDAMSNGSLWTLSAAGIVQPLSPRIRRHRRHVAEMVRARLRQTFNAAAIN